MIDTNQVLFFPDQGAHTCQKGEYIAFFFMNNINVLMIILVKDGQQLWVNISKILFNTEVNALIII